MAIKVEDLGFEDQPEVLKKLTKLVSDLADKYKLSLFMFVSQETGHSRERDGVEHPVACGVCISHNVSPSCGEAMGAALAQESEGRLGSAVMSGFLKAQLKDALSGEDEPFKVQQPTEVKPGTVH